MKKEERSNKSGGGMVNFRPALACAIGLASGIALYGKCRFGGLAPSDFLFLGLFVVLSLFPLSKKRICAVLLCVLCFAGIGALGIHLYTNNFAEQTAGEVRLSGTVQSVSLRRGYSVVILGDLAIDGEPCGGKCRAVVDADVLPADVLVMTAILSPVSLDEISSDVYARSSFAADIRYFARVSEAERTGRSKNVLLRLNGAIFETLHENMPRDEADLTYALLTGGSGSMEEDLDERITRGGIAHIFAVSGLHIGILYSAAYLCCKPLKKYRFLPALGLAALYCGVCGFTVSATRATVMCAVLGTSRALGKKYDFLSSLSVAATLVLLFLPGQWFSAGMRLSFGACAGLALFAGSFSRGLARLRAPRFLGKYFARLRVPRFLGKYLAASLSVQLFLFPVLLDAFGYFSVWGMLLTLALMPVLPALFLGSLVCTLGALIVPPAAAVFLVFPQGMFSLLIHLLWLADATLVLSGFALGAGAAVWVTGCAALSERVRLGVPLKVTAAVVFAALFALTVTLENVVFAGVRIDVYRTYRGAAALVRTSDATVLVIDDGISAGDCESFLMRNYGGTLSLVVALGDEVSAANTAAFLPAEEVRLRREAETGLRETEIAFGERFSCGELEFYYESEGSLLMMAEGVLVKFDFRGGAAGADLVVGAAGGARYQIKDGTVWKK